MSASQFRSLEHRAAAPAVLADALLPSSRTVDALLIAAGALLVAAAAQIEVPLGFTPVPLSGQTFGLALVAAGLGARRGAAALGLYVVLGALGLPFYAGGAHGAAVLAAPTAGYLVGFIPAAALIGWLGERRADRSPVLAFLAMLAGSLVIFAFGVSWLAISLGVGLREALVLGCLPFLPGDLLKSALAAGVLPAAWRLLPRRSR